MCVDPLMKLLETVIFNLYPQISIALFWKYDNKENIFNGNLLWFIYFGDVNIYSHFIDDNNYLKWINKVHNIGIYIFGLFNNFTLVLVVIDDMCFFNLLCKN